MQESEFKLLTKASTHLTGKEQKPSPASQETALTMADLPHFSRQQPPWHVFVLSVFTLGIYNLYWFFKCLTQLNEEARTAPGTDSKPGADSAAVTAAAITPTAGGAEMQAKENPLLFCQNHPYFSCLLFLVPVANLVIGMQFFALVGELLPDKQSFWHRQKYFCAFALALAFGALFLFWTLPEPAHLLYLLSALPLAVVQGAFNKHWRAVEQDKLLVRTALNPIELVVFFFGAGFLFLCLIGPSVTPHTGH